MHVNVRLIQIPSQYNIKRFKHHKKRTRYWKISIWSNAPAAKLKQYKSVTSPNTYQVILQLVMSPYCKERFANDICLPHMFDTDMKGLYQATMATFIEWHFCELR